MNALTPIQNARTVAALRSAIAAVMADQKHDHNHDFGFPDHLTFQQLYAMWDRNSLAQAGVSRIASTIWRDDPALHVSEDTHEETTIEAAIRQHFEDKRLWSKMADAYQRSLVGDFSVAILRVADGRQWNQPVGRVNGIKGLWDIIPAWEGQITVANWDQDPMSERYGLPAMYQFDEQQIEDGKERGAVRSLAIHPDRVLVMSSTGDMFGRSVLRAGFNDLITYAKVIGAGGEGFWKAARSSLSLEVDKDARLSDLASAMGVDVSDLPEKIDAVVADFVAGYDKSLMLQGIKPTAIGVTLPANPDQYAAGPRQGFAASLDCPDKVLIGNQTGERASTEDLKLWNATCASRRNREVMPVLRDMVQRLENWGALPQADWVVQWSDLTEPTGADKLAGAKTMAEINAASVGLGDTPFSAQEIREQAGFEAEQADNTPEGE
jgi:hypothetical protein